jgi:LysM repeat protein
MNNPSPLIPQGTLLDQKNKSRARVKVAFFCVVGVHVAAILTALLAQGCKREAAPEPQLETQQPFVSEYTNTVPEFEPTNTIVDTTLPTTVLPPVAEAPIVAPAPITQEHVVQKGESFSTIAPKYNVSVRAIQAANPTVNPTRLQIGQKLIIPPPAPPTENAVNGAAAPVAATGELIYTVKAGDNLTKIAAAHGTTISAIRQANNLVTDQIKVGAKLKIPAPSSTP